MVYGLSESFWEGGDMRYFKKVGERACQLSGGKPFSALIEQSLNLRD